jgi:hypothetical protein
MVETRYLLGNFIRNIFVDGPLEEETTVGIFFIRNVETFTTEMLDRYFLSQEEIFRLKEHEKTSMANTIAVIIVILALKANKKSRTFHYQ